MANVRLVGQDDAMRNRDGYLHTFDNETKATIFIDLETTAIPVLLGICFLIGIMSNGALFYTICKSKKFRNVPNGFLLNIVIVNMIMLIVCAPMIATSYVLEGKWPFGPIACKIVHFIPQASVAVSMFSLVALSVERYAAFAAPPKHRNTAKNRACFGNLIIWVVGAGCGLPLAGFAYEESYYNDVTNEKAILCQVFDRRIWAPLYPKIHTIVSISFIFLVPIILCVIFYLSLSCVVCGKKQRESRLADEDSTPLKNGTRSSRSGTLTKDSSNTKTNTIRTIDSRTSVPTLKKAVRKRRTMAKVALFLMLQFTIFWAPYWAYTLRWYFSYEPMDTIWYLVNLIGLICIYFNATLTPFTVVVCNRIFRQHLGKYLCCCFSCLHCCVCLEKSEKVEAALESTSDISAKKTSNCCFCCPCCLRQEDDEDLEETDSQSNDSNDVADPSVYLPQEQANVYQELPGQANYYDSFTIPVNPSHRYPSGAAVPHRPVSEQYSHTYAASDSPHRSSYVVTPNQERPYHPASYHGDDMLGPHVGPSPSSPYGTAPRGNRYTSEPYLHAQAPKYSRIFQLHQAPHLGQATSIKEMPAM